MSSSKFLIYSSKIKDQQNVGNNLFQLNILSSAYCFGNRKEVKGNLSPVMGFLYLQSFAEFPCLQTINNNNKPNHFIAVFIHKLWGTLYYACLTIANNLPLLTGVEC